MRQRFELKRSLKCAISLVVFAATFLSDALWRVFGKKAKGRCVVLYYHSIPAEQRTQFVSQLRMIVRHGIPIGVGGDTTLEVGKKYVGVTFDDGFENFFQIASPELTKLNIPSTMFVISDAIGKAFGPEGRSEKVMSLEQIRALPVNLVTIGSHTSSHPFLPGISEQDATSEIVRSRTKIEELLGRKVELFSFPFGGFNEKLVDICRSAGYHRIFTTLPGFAFENADEYVVGRVRVDPTDWPLEFRLKLAGAYRWLPKAFAIKRKIVANKSTRWPLEHEHHAVDRSSGRKSFIQDSSSH
jgi:peptidoglycan/xylan/chitin deacetylase (PgdA/CDA1 family)